MVLQLCPGRLWRVFPRYQFQGFRVQTHFKFFHRPVRELKRVQEANGVHGKTYLGAAPGCSIGRRIWKVVPTPTSLSTVIVPWWASTTSLTIFVPNPEPLLLLLMARAVNRRSRISGGMPRPVSATDSRTTPLGGSIRPRTVTEPPVGTSGMALLIRL